MSLQLDERLNRRVTFANMLREKNMDIIAFQKWVAELSYQGLSASNIKQIFEDYGYKCSVRSVQRLVKECLALHPRENGILLCNVSQ